MSVYLEEKPLNADLWHDMGWWPMAQSTFLPQNMQSRHFISVWTGLLQNYPATLNEIARMSCSLSHSWGYTFSEAFFSFPSGIDWTAEVNECVRWLGRSVEKSLLSPLKWLVRRITKTVYLTHYWNPVWVRNRGLSHNTGSCPQA